MDRPDRNEKDDAQKAKLVFLSLAALVTILLIWSLYTMNKARTERDVVKQEAEMLKQDSVKLEQLLKDQQCESKPKAKPAAKKKAPSKSTKKSSKTTKHK
jgi:regulatory protein YycI of two-component signal transduction system YycFG